MAVALSGMTLYTNNDNEGNWGGTDGPDTYNVSIQGTNSESWLVSKNATETGTLTLTPGTAPDATRSLFMFWMKSDLSYYYTDIKAELILFKSLIYKILLNPDKNNQKKNQILYFC